MSPIGWSSEVEAISTVLLVIIAILTFLYTRRNDQPRYKTRLIRSLRDPDLPRATDLYTTICKRYSKKGLAPELVDSPEDIVRWIEEDLNENRGQNKKWPERTEYFIIAKALGKVHGFLYCSYYRYARLLFISYLGATKSEAANHLVAFIAKTMVPPKCYGVVAEVSDEREFRSFRTKARLLGTAMRELDIGYKQPRLDLHDKQYPREVPLKLLYGRTIDRPRNRLTAILLPTSYGTTNRQSVSESTIPNKEGRRILWFLYNKYYGDSKENSAELDKEYREYVRQLYERTSESLGDGDLPWIIRQRDKML
jgi:hypothetical protein